MDCICAVKSLAFTTGVFIIKKLLMCVKLYSVTLNSDLVAFCHIFPCDACLLFNFHSILVFFGDKTAVSSNSVLPTLM